MEDSRQSREHGVSLLVHRRKITADAAKSGDPSHTTKGARNLLLHFRPAKVPLGLVVRERNAQVVEQSQHLLGAPEQRIQQILGLTLLAPTLVRSCGRGGWRRLSRIASRHNLEVARGPFVALHGGNRGQVEQTPLVACVMQIEQEVLYLHGPLLMLRLGDCRTIAHQVGSTDTVSTVIAIIAGQSIVHASRGMPRQMGQEASTVHMQPMKHPIHADASLISMLEPTGSNQLGNALNRRSQPLGGQFVPRKPGRFRDLAPTDRGESLTGASRGKQLPLVQIHGQHLHVGTILDGGSDLSGETAQASGVMVGQQMASI